VLQLEGAIAALRAIVANIASNDALVRLSDDIRTLSSKVDQLAQAGANNDSYAILEQRIAALTSTLESRERPAANDHSEYLEGALRALSDRLDRMPVGNDSEAAFAHLEQRVSYLLERLETAISDGSRTACRTSCVTSRTSTRALPHWPRTTGTQARRRRWIPVWSMSSSANCPTSASASRKPIVAPRTRSKPFTTPSAMWWIVWR
jgi:outer membrane murein-binding lipoprotein Lpp